MSQQEQSNSGATISNLRINSDTIIFHPENHNTELILSNLHQNYTLYFKIKTKIQKVFDVKPSIGSIKPGEQQIISFKAMKKLEANELPNLQQNLLFLLQAINHTNPTLTKQQEQNLWKQIKARKVNVELGYCSVKLGITFSESKSKPKELIPQFAKLFQSKTESRYTSEVGKPVKAVSSISSLPNSNFRQSNNEIQGEIITGQQMSRKYEELKQKQENLIKQRQKLFEGTPAPKKSKGSSPLKLIIILIISFLLGNFLKSKLQPLQIPRQQQKGLFDWFS